MTIPAVPDPNFSFLLNLQYLSTLLNSLSTLLAGPPPTQGIIYFFNNFKYSRTLQKCLTSVRALKKDPHPDKEDYRLCPVESHLHQDKEEFSLSQTKEHPLQCPP